MSSGQSGPAGGIGIALSRPPARPGPGTRAERAERALILLVALHSAVVGAALSLFPRFALALAGFGEAPSTFFPRQAGIFHLVLAFGYLAEHFRHRGITLLLFAKAAATVFLLAAAAGGGMPWAVPFCGVADGLMGAAAWAVHRMVRAGSGGPAGA